MYSYDLASFFAFLTNMQAVIVYCACSKYDLVHIGVRGFLVGEGGGVLVFPIALRVGFSSIGGAAFQKP